MALYLESFSFPDAEQESGYILSVRRTCYTSFYPFQVLTQRGFHQIEFAPVTILYGGNGTGKSTALQVIAHKMGLERSAPYNGTAFFDDYAAMCCAKTRCSVPQGSCMITSDDVFDQMLSIREINLGLDRRREDMFEEYWEARRSGFQLSSMEDYDQLRKVVRARKWTQSRFVREELGMNVRTFSNGENAFRFFTNRITENRLYLLDEPENSLSPERQIELLRFLADSVRFFGCQFVISTHSPFLLSLSGARIYDLDSDPVEVRRWTELRNVRTYYEFFAKNRSEFED